MIGDLTRDLTGGLTRDLTGDLTMDSIVQITPAERERYNGYYLLDDFTRGHDDIILGTPNARRPAKTDIKATRAYNYGREFALNRGKHHASHRGLNHFHQCEFCSFTWWHSEKSLDCEVCHTCPNCDAAHQNLAIDYGGPEEEKKFLWAKLDNLITNHKPTPLNVWSLGHILIRLKQLGELNVSDL